MKYNIGILAHADAGKTTITEQLLLKSGAIRKSGSVDDGTTVSDSMEVERKRGISVRNTCLSINFENDTINIIDTPGHMDFAGEVVRSLRAVDGVVLVISAAEGVQAQTLSIFHILKEMKLPVIFAVNKIDRAGFDEAGLLKSVRRELSERTVPLQTVRNGSIVEKPLSDAAFEMLAELDEDMELAYLSEEVPEDSEILEKLCEYAKKAEVYPLVYTEAKNGKGIDALIKSIVSFLPDSESRNPGFLYGTVFQVRHEKGLGKAAYIRLFGGTLRSRDSVPLPGNENEEPGKISQIKCLTGGKLTDSGSFSAGDIAVVYGLKSVKTGDCIISEGEIIPENTADSLLNELAVPLLLTGVSPVNPQDETKLSAALAELSDEDPFLRFEQNLLTHEMNLHIMGEIQIEILKEMLLDRYGLKTEFSPPRVIYKETAGIPAVGHEEYTMPKPCWAILDLKIEPLSPGSGLQFVSEVHESELPVKYQNHVEISVYKTLQQGIYGWEVTDARVSLISGNHHQWHTHPLDFFVAAPIAVLRALKNSGPRLLEPYMKLHLEGDEGLMGRVGGQILRMRGITENQIIDNGKFIIDALVPLKDCMDYPVSFRSMTSGKGVISMKLDSYRPCPPGFTDTLARRSVDPLDRSKWILSCRSAMGEGERWA